MTAVSASWFNRYLWVWREHTEEDGSGGFYTEFVNRGKQRFKVDQSSAAEQAIAQQDGATHTHNIYTFTYGDIRRGDMLAVEGVDPNDQTGETYRVLYTTTPSTPIYLKCPSERIQHSTHQSGSSS